MIAGQSVLAVITARGGSKGVPRKNLRSVAGRPLIVWSVAAARASRHIDRLVVSTDDDGIIAAAVAAGCEAPFRRPAELARDETPGVDPVLHAIEQVPGYAIVVLLQPTSPLRQGADIDACLERMIATGAPACITMREALDHPYWTFGCAADGRLQPFAVPATGVPARRQDLPRAFVPNGAVYAARIDWLLRHRTFETGETVGCEMPALRSLDIDTETDLAAADAALRRP